MDLKKLRIGYVPYSHDYEKPGDKRRFVFYANKRNINFEIADPSKDYDLVVLSQNADLSIWSNYNPGGAKIVYDLIDSYLAISRNEIKGRLRGLAKFVAGKSKYLKLNQWKSIESMCVRADAVVCTTKEQESDIFPFCKNVHQILDVHTSIERQVKKNYERDKVFNIVWEGIADNAYAFNSLKNVFKNIEKKHQIALHFVTDLSYRKYSGKFGKTYTSDVVKDLSSRVYLYEWNERMVSEIICSCDLAVIPVDLNNPLVRGKPENKLILFWRMGMPVITSATPAYNRTMKSAGLDMTCKSEKDWYEVLEKYITSKESREIAGTSGKRIAEKDYGEECILRRWDYVFESIF